MRYRIQLDICSLCNLNCPACSMRRLNYGKIGAGYLKFDTFKNFIDNNIDYIKCIEISNSGEPFLNPDVIKILEYAYINNIDILVKNGTNFNFNNDNIIKALVDYKVKLIHIAIDGATASTYEKYRRNGNFNLVMSNLEKLIEYKKQKDSIYPEIVWQYVVRESTESSEEILLAKNIAQKFNIPIDFKLTWETDYIPKDANKLKDVTGLDFLTRKEANHTQRYSKFHKCKALYKEEKIVINWDGRWLGCCGNRYPSDINVFECGIKGLLDNVEYKNVKYYLINDNRYSDDIPNFCKKCITSSFNKEERQQFIFANKK